MNIEINKHDLFRNVVPGYIFLIVIFSFYAITNQLDSVSETPMAIIGIIAGFPLGFIISTLYRIIFHFGVREQKQMEREDENLIQKFLNASELKYVNSWFETAYTAEEREKKKSKAFSYVFDRILYANEEKSAYRERILFLISFVHSLGAASFAIILAVIFIFLIKLPLWHSLWWYKFPYHWKEYNHEGIREISLIIVWLIVAGILYLGRRSVKKSFAAAKKAFFFNHKKVQE